METTTEAGLSLVGSWSLVRIRALLADGRETEPPFGPEPMGMAMFRSAGWMICALCDGRPPAFDEPREYVSYSGAYRYDGNTLITRVELSSDPARIGGDELRSVTFTDRRHMILAPPQRLRRGTSAQLFVDWVRLDDAI